MNNIPVEQWVEHFKSFFCTDMHVNSNDSLWKDGVYEEAVNDGENDEWLNYEISLEEGKASVRSLKNGKAPGF